MWPFFGVITLISFTIYNFYKKLKSNWDGDIAKVNGLQYSYTLLKHKSDVQGILIGIDGVQTFDFKLKEERWYDDLATKIGLSVEQQAGQNEFDKAIYIASDDPAFLTLLKSKSRIRDDFLKLFNVNHDDVDSVREVRCTKDKLWVHYLPVYSDIGFQQVASIAEKMVHRLYAIKDDLVSIQNEQPQSKKRDPFVLKAAIFLALSSGLFYSGLVQLYRELNSFIPFTLNPGELILMSFGLMLVLLFLLLSLTLLFLGRSSRTHLVFIELILIGAMGLFINSFTFLKGMNLELDTSNGEQYRAEVVGKHTSRAYRSTNYYLTIANWTDQDEQIRVDFSLFQKVHQGSTVYIIEKAGYLGIPWVDILPGD